MKRVFLVIASLAAGMAVSTSALADLQLATAKNCMACHAVATKLVGPSYKDVATKYAGQKDAVDKLSVKILKGGAGVWGPVPMTPHPALSKEDASQMVKYILLLKNK